MSTLEFIVAIVGTTAFNQLVTFLIGHRKNKIDEAAIVASISAKLREELFQKYEERGRQISVLRRVIIKLTNLIEECIPRIRGLTTAELERLRDVTLETRLAGLSAES